MLQLTHLKWKAGSTLTSVPSTYCIKEVQSQRNTKKTLF